MFVDTHLVLVKSVWLFRERSLLESRSHDFSESSAGGFINAVDNAFTTSAESSLQVLSSPEAFGSGGSALICPPCVSVHQRKKNMGKKGGRDYQKESEKG